jgi:hypothetical protein
MDTHRIHAYADMFDKMHRILDQARSESAWWPPARCRGILADLQRVVVTFTQRVDTQQMPYTAWDLSFGALIRPLWHVIHSESWEELYDLNVRVWRTRCYVDALTPLLQAVLTVDHVTDVMDQLDLEGSAEADDPNPIGVDG